MANTIPEVCQMIADDMASDVKEFMGQPFNGRTVGEFFGKQAAAIEALAQISKRLTVDMPNLIDALRAAKEHLDYTGYGDKWERECAQVNKLEEKIDEALKPFPED